MRYMHGAWYTKTMVLSLGMHHRENEAFELVALINNLTVMNVTLGLEDAQG